MAHHSDGLRQETVCAYSTPSAVIPQAGGYPPKEGLSRLRACGGALSGPDVICGAHHVIEQNRCYSADRHVIER